MSRNTGGQRVGGKASATIGQALARVGATGIARSARASVCAALGLPRSRYLQVVCNQQKKKLFFVFRVAYTRERR